MATWPASLPAPLVEGYGGSIAVSAEWVDLGGGWSDAIDRGNPIQQPLSAAMVLSEAQAGALRVYHRDNPGEWATVPLQVADNATALVDTLARIVGPIQFDAIAPGYWRASLAFEVAPA